MINELGKFDLLLPWEKCSHGLEIELKKEVSPKHVLFGIEAVSIARRVDNDDVLFFLPKYEKPLAVVHLTWSGKYNQDFNYPLTRFFFSLDDWVVNCLEPDHQNYEN